MSKCKNCHIEFEAKRSTRQFCTTMCKNQFHNFSKYPPRKSVVYLLQNENMVRVSRTDAPTCQIVMVVDSVEDVINKYGSEWFVGNIVNIVRDVKIPPVTLPTPPTQSHIAPITTPPPVPSFMPPPPTTLG